MRKKLGFQACLEFGLGMLMIGVLLFVPAGTLKFWNAWLLIGALAIPMIILGIVLLVKAPQLLAKRLNKKETEKAQGWVILLSAVMFVGGFVIAGLDFRWQGSSLPAPVIATALIVFLLGYALYAEVLRENAYLSRTVEVQENQKVIDTGLYGIVRHPMYLATIMMFMTMPLILGSFYAFLLFLIYPAVLIWRIRNEEEVLLKGLKGYRVYKEKVKYRLIPYLW